MRRIKSAGALACLEAWNGAVRAARLELAQGLASKSTLLQRWLKRGLVLALERWAAIVARRKGERALLARVAAGVGEGLAARSTAATTVKVASFSRYSAV